MTTQMSFATRSEGPLQEVTERRPRLAIDAYPMGRLLLLRCFGDVDGLDGAAEINGSGGKVLHATRTGDEVTLLLDGSGREEEIIASLADQSAHLIPPIRWQHGEARVTLVLEDRAEHHVVRAMLPMVRARSGREDGEALEVYSKFSRELGLYVQLEVLGDRVAAVRLARKAPLETAGSEHPYLARILEHVHTGKGDLQDIPLSLEVAPFEREVLEFLRTIPPGETITYGEIARRLGRPGASRAVGTACARNPVVIVIPCHRVVPKSGGLGNYSSEGGPETKRRLLEREGARVALEMKTAPSARRSQVKV